MTKDKSAGKVQLVALADLHIDKSYQRDKRPHHKNISKQFDPESCNDLTVGQRKDGTLWIIDGQQRYNALLLRGVSHWRARVIPSDGPAHEAVIYATLNGGNGTVRQITGKDLFKARLRSGDPHATAVVAAVKDAGMELASTNQGKCCWPYLSSFARLYDYAKVNGQEKLTEGLTMVATCWKGSDGAVASVVVQSVLDILVNNPDMDRVRLQKILEKIPAVTILQESQVGGHGGHRANAYAYLARQWNRGLPSRSAQRIKDSLRSAVISTRQKDPERRSGSVGGHSYSAVKDETADAVEKILRQRGGSMLQGELLVKAGVSKTTLRNLLKTRPEVFESNSSRGGYGDHRKAVISLVDSNGRK